MNKYFEWIDEYNQLTGDSYNCKDEVIVMKTVFPELIIVIGYAVTKTLWIDIKIAHCWLKDINNNIIDPTVKQFKGKKVEYIEWDVILECDGMNISSTKRRNSEIYTYRSIHQI